MAETKIVVGPQPFSVGEEYPWLAERDEYGAVGTFTGKVRNHNPVSYTHLDVYKRQE